MAHPASASGSSRTLLMETQSSRWDPVQPVPSMRWSSEGSLGREGSLQPISCNNTKHSLSLETLPWSTSSQKEGGPIGQPRRENPSRVTGTSGGSGERDATQPLRDKEEGLASVEVEEQRGRPSPRCGVQQRGPTRKPN